MELETQHLISNVEELNNAKCPYLLAKLTEDYRG